MLSNATIVSQQRPMSYYHYQKRWINLCMVIYTFSKVCKSPTASLPTGQSLAMVIYWNLYCLLGSIGWVCKSPTASLSTGDSLVMDISYLNRELRQTTSKLELAGYLLLRYPVRFIWSIDLQQIILQWKLNLFDSVCHSVCINSSQLVLIGIGNKNWSILISINLTVHWLTFGI